MGGQWGLFRFSRVNETQYQLLRVIRKIRLFQGLGRQHIQALLPLCKLVSLEPLQNLYNQGDPSREMLLLLTGKLWVVRGGDEVLAEIGPGSSVGEMGFFTGEARSADIVVAEQSTGFRVDKKELIKLLDSNPAMKAGILGNVVAVLSERLVEANQLVLAYTNTIAKMEDQLVRHIGMNSVELDERGL